MVTLTSWLSPARLAGLLAILIAVTDHWAFHDGFGLDRDIGLMMLGLGWLGGVVVGSLQERLSLRK